MLAQLRIIMIHGKISNAIRKGRELIEAGKSVGRTYEPFNTLDNIIKKRRSVRKYADRSVPDMLIEKILDAARYAPTVWNRQPWEFIVVKSPDTKKHLVEAAGNQKWMKEAPVFVAVCINMKIAGAGLNERGEKLYGIQTTAMAIQNILLSAEALGLGACWVAEFSEHTVSIALHCPNHIRPAAIITLGYPAEKPAAPSRHALEEVMHKETFGRTKLEEKVRY